MSRPAVELRILRRGVRRQAQYRVGPKDSWHDLLVSAADKALREGKITLGKVECPVVVSRETRQTPVHPHAEAFTAQAVALNDSLNAIYANGGAA